MQIHSIGLYSHDGALRPLRFKLGALNVISGPSRTGKSELVKIIDFCCGRTKPKLAPGPITTKVAWFAVLFQGHDGRRVLVARPQPSGASTSQAMLAFGTDLELPASGDLLVADADNVSVRNALNDLLGLRDFEPDAFGGNRERLRATVGHAIQFCLQNQNELSSPEHLFHRGSDADVARDFRDLFPFFLGADSPEALARRRRATDLRRQLRYAEQELTRSQAMLETSTVRDQALLDRAVAAGLTDDRDGDARGRLQTIQQLARSTEAPPRSEDPDVAERPTTAALRSEVGDLRQHLQEVRERRAGLASLRDHGTRHAAELATQVGRLGIVEHFHKDGSPGDVGTCPGCGQHLKREDDDLAALVADSVTLSAQLGSLQSVGQDLSAAERELDALIEGVQARYERARNALAEAQHVDDAAGAIATQSEERAFVLGVISEHLRQASSANPGAVAELEAKVARLSGLLEAVTEGIAADDVVNEVEVRLESLSDNMTKWARGLDLERADSGVVRIDRKTLNVSVSTGAGRVDLEAMGSGANHVGYHLVAHLALHRHFVEQHRPVPRFVVFDQPSLPFFPKTAQDKDAMQKDVDWAAVKSMFVLVDEVVAGMGGRFQSLMTDHATFDEPWFERALVESWHDGKKLVPDEWPDAA